MISYKDSGVDIEKGEKFVNSIKQRVQSTYGPNVLAGIGGFASLYKMGDGRLLAAGTDGVGTKLNLAQKLNKHDTIGQDLVAMCVNDILCTGAKGLFFMDYLACGELDLAVSEQIIEGIVRGCELAQMALIGGETAEMPGMYKNGEYDLAGFAVGEVMQDQLIDGKTIQAGDRLVGIASSGMHSNGFSLIRQVLQSSDDDLMHRCLTPTKIYTRLMQAALAKFATHIKGMAHITGGGFKNISRMNENFHYNIEFLPEYDELPPEFKIIGERTGLGQKDLYSTFNMGVGLVLATDRSEQIIAYLKNADVLCWDLGVVSAGAGINLAGKNGAIAL